MSRLRRSRAILSVVLSCAVILGCQAKVLDLEPPDGAGGTGPGAASGVQGTARIEDLTDAEANQLCSWLTQTSPLPPGEGTSTVPGYASGSSFGCTGLPIGLVWLSQTDCVANLRHSPCSSTVSSLERCVGYLDSHYTNPDCANGGAAQAACAEYKNGASCGETVLQAALSGDGPGCSSTILPVSPGATCPPGAPDASAD